MHRKALFLIIFIFLAGLFSCKWESSDVLPSSNGRIYEVMVVMARERWQAEPGQVMREILQADIPALNTQEPMFDLLSIPFDALKNVTRFHRNLILVKIGSDQDGNAITFQKDVYASPQVIVQIKAKGIAQFRELMEKNKGLLVDFLLKTERERTVKGFQKLMDQASVTAVEKSHGIRLPIPKGFRLNKDSLLFTWISQETPEISLGLFVYSRPYRDTSDFSQVSLLQTRDNLLALHVPGPRPGSYMCTERDYALHHRSFFSGKEYFTEIRGLWKVKGDFMGGPFISISRLSGDGKTIITTEGYVYAPNKNKRNYLRQLESIIYSSSFPAETQK